MQLIQSTYMPVIMPLHTKTWLHTYTHMPSFQMFNEMHTILCINFKCHNTHLYQLCIYVILIIYSNHICQNKLESSSL